MLNAPGCSPPPYSWTPKTKKPFHSLIQCARFAKQHSRAQTCTKEYGIDLVLVQETFLKPSRPRSCALPGYIQLRTDRTDAPLGGTAIYYKRSLHCCPIDLPTLSNIEATGCRLAVTGHGTLVIVSIYLPSSKSLLRSDLEALLALGDSVILFGDFNSKNRKWGCGIPNTNGTNLYKLSKELKFKIIAPPTPTHYPDTLTSRPSTLDLAISKGVSLYLHCIEEIDTPALNNIPDVIQTTDEIDSSIGALTNHIQKVVKRCSREVPAAVDRRKVPADALELIRAKNAALRHAYAYPTSENRCRARALQRRVRARMLEVKNEEWSNLMEDITPSHQAFWKLTKALKSEGLELQCSHTIPPVDIHHITRVEEEIRHKTSLEPRDDLSPVSLDEVQKLVKKLNAKKAPGLDGMSNKAIKCFPITFLSLLVAIVNACLKNCYFPPVWKEAVVIGIHKPGKPRDLPASYRPISLLSGLGKINEKILKSRLSEYLFSKGLIIN
ncbi:RNA-directed DNA polymerase from mobile element jockey [Eumeta japonica]|uniref:RNA-directed DNA polymerase from mobile element jockey n=1 Tax=Eumeta variegata TaxID=151549 RepID=A0A4C1UX53_EUMVA|nr:RNA-directed DNA polymerase from mobile element jockey [Eumeta japonica]